MLLRVFVYLFDRQYFALKRTMKWWSCRWWSNDDRMMIWTDGQRVTADRRRCTALRGYFGIVILGVALAAIAAILNIVSCKSIVFVLTGMPYKVWRPALWCYISLPYIPDQPCVCNHSSPWSDRQARMSKNRRQQFIVDNRTENTDRQNKVE